MMRRVFLAAKKVGTVGMAVVAVVALAGCGSDAAGSGGNDGTSPPASMPVAVTPQEGQAMLQAQAGAITLIDVRTPDEFAAGHLEGAVNMDVEGGQFSALIQDLPRDGAYMVYCHSGRRSAIAAGVMVAAGFTTVYDLGGIQDWQAAGLPVVTD